MSGPRSARNFKIDEKKSVYQSWEWQTFADWSADWLRKEAKKRNVSVKMIDDADLKLALVQAMLKSPLFTIRNAFYTTKKDSELALIDPFEGQLILDIAIESQRKRGYAQRVVEIKPRQVGWTAWNLARAAWTGLQPRKQIAFFIPEQKVADELTARFGDVYNNLGWMAPMRRIENRQQVVFANPSQKLRDDVPGLDTSITFSVPSGQRGRTPNMAVLSEYAHWMDKGFDPADFMDALLSGMSAGPESCVIIDTTPNGYDEDYWPIVEDAIKDNPKWVKAWERRTIPTREEIINGALGEPDEPDGWVPAFVSFLWHPQYTTRDESPVGQLPKPTKAKLDEFHDTYAKDEQYGGEEERELVERYGATPGRLLWRRWKIKNDIQGYDPRQKLLTFRQEYATSWRSPFIDFGNNAFDPLGLDIVTRMPKPPMARGMLRRDDSRATVDWYIDQTFRSDWEEMRFWAPASSGEQYVIGADLGWSFETMEADETYVQVIRRRDRKQVAVYQARAPMHRVRQAIWALYLYYNRAFTAIETKGPGKNLVFELYQMGVTNQYKWKRLDKEDVKDTDYLGWETSEHTRGTMEGILVEEIAWRDENDKPAPGIILRDQVTVDQLVTVKRYPDGKIKARSGHDDAVDALMIALAADRDPLRPYVPPRAQQALEVDQAIALFTRGAMGNSSRTNHPALADM